MELQRGLTSTVTVFLIFPIFSKKTSWNSSELSNKELIESNNLERACPV